MKSSCVKSCILDPERGLCLGCGRTLKEIGDWFSLTDAERRAVMEELSVRPNDLKSAR